ncbi:MAG: hypothetical protein HOY71_13090, partial [Nonomuraea sp.]|nr:hypothetical protein [Nonomuraea sp.]
QADALPRTTELKQALWTAASGLLDRARAAGAVRADVTAADLVPLMCGIAYATQVHGGDPAERAGTARRYLTMLLEGLTGQESRSAR